LALTMFKVGELSVDRSAFIDALISSISESETLQQELLTVGASVGVGSSSSSAS
jgi:hypothetical protein